jgi:glucose/arabinose dehydrogenase
MKTTMLAALCALSLSALAASPPERYAESCAGCHTADPGSFFRASSLVRQGSVTELARIIREGRPVRGMPAFAALPAADVMALATWLKSSATSATTGTMIGRRIEAESLRKDRSAGYDITRDGETTFLQWIDRGSHLCYDDLDLTGVRSVEYRYAKGEGEPPRRFALVAFQGDFGNGRRFTLGEKNTPLTAGWTTFRDERIGLSQQLSGRYRLCIIGMGGGGVFNLDHFTLSDRPGSNDGITLNLDINDQVIQAGGHGFRLEKVAEIDGEFWSLDFLDNDTLLATQKTGALWMFRKGRKTGPITGTPEVFFHGQGGLLSVRAHPDHRRNGWIYLTYTERPPHGDLNRAMLTIVRGRIRDGRWTDQQTIYRADPGLFTDHGEHFGARISFGADYLYFGIGDRGQQDKAQELGSPFGKIHRVFDDGRIPADNPFAHVAGALPTLWSLGHRNPQGLVFDVRTNALWSSEHGPKGGDEVNLIERGRNYGWPRVTHGVNYDGSIVSAHSEGPGFEPPRAHWSPSPGMSNLVVYEGDAFPRWRHHLLVATLAHQKLLLLQLQDGRVIGEVPLIEGLGRIRDVITGPDGRPYIALNQPNGQIFRLEPVKP